MKEKLIEKSVQVRTKLIEAYEAGQQEERQFILNILDGIDIANKEMGLPEDTKAIRFALQSRHIK